MVVRVEGRDITDHQAKMGTFSRGIKVFCIITMIALTQIFMLKCTQQFVKKASFII